MADASNETPKPEAMDVAVIGGVLSSQPETDGTALNQEMLTLVDSQAVQLDPWYRKLASIEKRVSILNKAYESGNEEDIPVECRMKRYDFPTLPGELSYSAIACQKLSVLAREHQRSYLGLLLSEFRKKIIPMIESTISQKIETTKKDFIELNLPLMATATYIAAVAKKRNDRESLLTQAPGHKKKLAKHQATTHRERPDNKARDAPSTSRQPTAKSSFKPRSSQHKNKPYARSEENKKRGNKNKSSSRDDHRRR